MREKLPSLIKIHLITILMTVCSAGGNCIPGVAYTTAVFETGRTGWLGLAVSEIVMFLCADILTFTKYTGVLAVMAAFTVITRVMRSGETIGSGGGKRQPRSGAEKDIRARSLYAGAAMFLLEFADGLFEPMSFQKVGLALWYGILCGLLAALIANGVKAMRTGKSSFLNQRSETMISAACFLAAVAYAVLSAGFLPEIIEHSLICFLLLYMGYMYGAAMGALSGASVGLVLSFFSGEIMYLGILCFLGILCGLFKDLGRFAETIAFFSGILAVMFCGVPFLTELYWFIAALSAGGVWIFCDILQNVRSRRQGQVKKAECAGTFPAVCEEEGETSEILGEFAGEVMKRTRLEERKTADNPDADPAVIGRFWKTKYLETRETLAVCLAETGEILKNRGAAGEDFVRPEEEKTEELKARFEKRGIQVHGVWWRQNADGQTELRFLLDNGTGAGRKKAAPVMVKDLLPAINESFGMHFEPACDNRGLIGKERAVYHFIQTPNFKILHGSATAKKSEEEANGDIFEVAKIGTAQVLFGIADGVGSGKDAAKSAAYTLDWLEQFLKNGVSEETSMRLMDILELVEEDGQGAALDFGVINLNSGVCHLLKAGGAPGFILRGQWVEMIRAKTLPLGLMPGAQHEQNIKKLYGGDIVLLVSDGVVQAFPGEEKEKEICTFLAGTGELGPKEIARCLLDKALSFGKAADDMSVLAIGLYEA